MFINYDPMTGVSVNSFRKPAAESGDLDDLLSAMADGNSACCNLQGAASELVNNASDEAQAVLAAIEHYEQQESLSE